MSTTYIWITLSIFVIATLALAVYGLHLYVLLFLFRRRSTERRRQQAETIESYRTNHPDADWPLVTSQIPIYNEQEVARRIIESVAAMDYAKGRHEIQVLDDSTDDTRDVIDRVARRLVAEGADVKVVRRPTRDGYKAGALAHGLAQCSGQYVAVFDADFVPPPDFLKKAIPLIDSVPEVACIQGRWDHLNREESWLTEAEALGIDGHFAIEQGARAWNGLMMNFNGTAGVWRKEAIDDPKVGGWSGDTLTEDLDLSYRAQLAGWRMDYCLDMPCPAELPGTIPALKSQQRRWATGSIQVARKLLPRVWRAKLSLAEKVEATLHLTHYSVALWMLLLALLARPMLVVAMEGQVFADWFWMAWIVIILAAIAPSLTYAYARYSLDGRWAGLKTIPSMMVLGCGLCVNNGIAVVRGLFLRGGEFVRTPKSGSIAGTARGSTYAVAQNKLWLIELALGAYAAVSFVIYLEGYEHRVFSVFLFLYTIGFLVVGWQSRPRRYRSKQRAIDETATIATSAPATESAVGN